MNLSRIVFPVSDAMVDNNEEVHRTQVTLKTTSGTILLRHAVNSSQFYIGVSLAVLSSLFIGTSFILKKKGLLKLTIYSGTLRAGSGGFGYLREIQWWTGLATMAIGEMCNFAAYGFAPASVVTPLGALSVLVSALMAVRFLGEKLNALGKVGCILTVFGSIVIVIHAPKESDVNSLLDFANKISATEFITFSFFTSISIFCLIVYYGPRLGSKHVHIYILICSLLGAFTVTACKGLGAGLKEFLTDRYTYSKWLTFACALIILTCVLIQMVYLNKALDLFSTPIVTTVYYVLFTTCVLITSGVLFREWHQLAFVDIIACLVGFGITTCGLVLINYLKSNSSCDDTRPSSATSSSSSLAIAVKQPNQVKSYANLILDDESDFNMASNSNNEQRQPMLVMSERDLTS